MYTSLYMYIYIYNILYTHRLHILQQMICVLVKPEPAQQTKQKKNEKKNKNNRVEDKVSLILVNNDELQEYIVNSFYFSTRSSYCQFPIY